MRLTVTYYLDVISSWCFWAEPAWAELKKRHDGKVEFQWKIALLDKTGLPISRAQEEWFYRRSGTIMRSPFMLSSAWYDEPRSRASCSSLRWIARGQTLRGMGNRGGSRRARGQPGCEQAARTRAIHGDRNAGPRRHGRFSIAPGDATAHFCFGQRNWRSRNFFRVGQTRSARDGAGRDVG